MVRQFPENSEKTAMWILPYLRMKPRRPRWILELGVFLQRQVERPVDVVIMQKASPILRHEVLKNKIRLFEKDPVKRALLEAKAFHDFMDAVHYQKKRAHWRNS